MIPSKVCTIENSLFYKCNFLKRVNFLPNTQLVIIDDRSFDFSSIQSIIIPKQVIQIGERAFISCKNLESVEFQN